MPALLTKEILRSNVKQVSLSAHIDVHVISNVRNGQTNQFQPENHENDQHLL